MAAKKVPNVGREGEERHPYEDHTYPKEVLCSLIGQWVAC